MQVGGSGNLNADINVTPFVDICLVLLIIFMVVTPMLQEGVQVQLPYAKNTEKKEDDEDHAIVVALKTPQIIYVQRKQIPREQYLAEMTEIHDRIPRKGTSSKPTLLLFSGKSRKL